MIAVIAICAVSITGLLVGGKEVINNRIEIVEKTTIDRDYETIETTEGLEYLGGLVHNVQEIFSAGIKAGTSETEVINSSGQWVYQFNGTTITASGNASIGGTLGVTGVTTLSEDLIVNTNDLVVDISVEMVGIGTTTPGTMLEIYGGGNSIYPAITLNNSSSSDVDTKIIFEDNSTGVGIIFFDDSANVLVFATSTDADVITIDAAGAIVLGNTVAISETLTVTGETNLDTLVYGGDVFVTSSAVAATLSAAEFCDNSVISFDALASFTLTLPSTSTLLADCMPTAGDTKSLLLENATTGTANITIASGNDMTLLEPSGGDVIIAQNEWAIIQITYTDADDWAAIVTSIQDAD